MLLLTNGRSGLPTGGRSSKLTIKQRIRARFNRFRKLHLTLSKHHQNQEQAVQIKMAKLITCLEEEPWFHGGISRHKAEHLVLDEGDFLVRHSQSRCNSFVLTSIKDDKTPVHILIEYHSNEFSTGFAIQGKTTIFYNTIHDLIMQHMEQDLPIESNNGNLIQLKHPILRIH